MKFAIVGDPVEHSRSPAMHNAAFASLDVEAEFGFLHVPADGFSDVERALRSGDLDGVSVTMPHKHNAFRAADELSETAQRSGAVNTLVARDGILHGYNTDVAGVLHAVEEVGHVITTPALILGYGGAAAAALLAIEGSHVSVSGCDPEKAQALIDRVGASAKVVPWGTSIQSATVINATPLGMHGESLPVGVVERAGALIDMTYGTRRSPAVTDALAIGIPVADGLTMLVGQAVEAFEIFTGRNASLFVMDQAARA